MLDPVRGKGIALQVLVSSAIILSMLILAVTLVSVSYINNHNTLIRQVEYTVTLLADQVDNGIVQLTEPILKVADLLQLDPLAFTKTLVERKQRLPVLARTIDSNHLISAVYFGYKDGDFFLLRLLEGEEIQSQFSLPPFPKQAHYLLQTISRDVLGDVYSTDWALYDAQLNFIEPVIPAHYDYDPRVRPWFTQAKAVDSLIITPPYVFFSTGEIGLTFAIHNQQSGAILGIDASIQTLSSMLKELCPSDSAVLAVLDNDGNLIAYPNTEKLTLQDAQGNVALANIEQVDEPVLRALATLNEGPQLTRVSIEGKDWYGMKLAIDSGQGGWTLLFALPKSSLFADINRHLKRQLLLSAMIILLLMFVGWRIGRSVSRPLLLLSKEVGALASYDFRREIHIDSNVREVKLLSTLTNHMASAIQNFQSISQKLARAQDLDMTLDDIAQHLIAITSAQAGAVYLLDVEKKELTRATHTELHSPDVIHFDSDEWEDIHNTVKSAIQANISNLFITPLIDRGEKILGILVLLLPEKTEAGDIALYHFIEEISGSAATAISTRRQFEAQQKLLDSIIKLLADAIDAKSPYTSGHCERVPVLADMLIEAAVQAKDGLYEHFTMSRKERREFQIAAWLHDCGKLTSPEYVVDKATKLETLYNRIHEIRTRFEVLWRDAEITYLRGILDGGNAEELSRQRDAAQAKLQSDFQFIAHANMGSESMSEDDILRLYSLGNLTWVRHFSNRLGVSTEEQYRQPITEETLPVTEQLLSDKAEHIVHWGERKPPVERDNPENHWGFDMVLPKFAFNRGELHNLSVQRGTLTAEERFAINNHIVQTIRMLDALPLPDNLARVPDIAGNHHEKMNGTGYPRQLSAEQLSIPERIMAVTDVFEALTAKDRPYKKAKTLSESLDIMASFVKEQHIDGELFRLFLESGVYLRYAEKYLMAEQVDAVDLKGLLHKAGLEITGAV